MTNPTNSQNKSILAHLLSGRTITHLEAEKLFRCCRLAARVHDLKSNGYNIKSRMIHNKRTGKRYAEYYM